MPGSRASRRCRASTPGTSPTCGAASRRGSRSRAIVIDRVLEVARRQARDQARRQPLAAARWRGCRPASPPRRRPSTAARALTLVRDRILPAQRAFAEFLAREYVPAARPAIAWRTTPDGEASYRFLGAARNDDGHDARRDPPARAGGGRAHPRADGRDDRRRPGSAAASPRSCRCCARIRASTRRTPEELLEKASEIAKRADDGLPGLFGLLPRLPYGVRPVPADLAEGYTTGRYWPGSLAARPGGRLHGEHDAPRSAAAVRAAGADAARGRARASPADRARAGARGPAVLPAQR